MGIETYYVLSFAKLGLQNSSGIIISFRQNALAQNVCKFRCE